MTFGTFFLPGPTEVRHDVLSAMLRPMIPHRGAAFSALFDRLQAGLQVVFQTERPVFISTSSALGLMEAAVRNIAPGPILSLVNGAFSEKFAHIAEACGHEVDRYTVEWGMPHDPDALHARLARRPYSAITVVHSETSTGVLNPLRHIAEAAHAHGVPCLIDSVSGLAGAEVQADAWGLDYVLTGSQKALALPPGLAFAVASERILEQSAAQRYKGVYFDLAEFAAFAKKSQVPNTPALSLYYALDRQLDDLLVETMPARWARHAAMAAVTVQWVEHMRATVHPELRVLAPEGARSPTVTTVVLPQGVTSAAVLRAVAERGFTIGSGYGKLKDTTIRIGHMGDHTVDGVTACLAVCEEALRAVVPA